MDLVVQWHCLITSTELSTFNFESKRTEKALSFFELIARLYINHTPY